MYNNGHHYDLQEGRDSNNELRIVASAFKQVVYREDKWPVRHISLAGLLPDTHHFMTYDGSTTHPGCWETTTWLLMNKPIYMTKQEVSINIIIYKYNLKLYIYMGYVIERN